MLHCVSAGSEDASPQPWPRNLSGRAAVTEASFWRSDPAAALRGLAKILPPAASRRPLRDAKSALDIYTCPRPSPPSETSSSSPDVIKELFSHSLHRPPP